MSNVIFLNGISSSGKTSIARAIQHISPIPFLHFGIDTIIDMMPCKWLSFNTNSKDGCYFQQYQNEYGRAVSCHSGSYGQQVFDMGMKIIKTMLDCSLHFIIDEVVWEQKKMDEYRAILNNHQTTFVRMKCSRETATEREILRRDREVGLANDQFERLDLVKCDYNLTIDTDQISSFKSAQEILKLIL